MKKKIFFIVLVMSILIMSSFAIAVKPDNPPGLSKEKNANAPGQLKKTLVFESQKHFVHFVHDKIIERLESQNIIPNGLIKLVNEFMSENEEVIEELLPPIAKITWTEPLITNTPIFFDASSSYDPDGGEITLIEWDVNGDGAYEISYLNPYLEVYDNPGTYSIGLRVTDDDGQIGSVIETVMVI